MPETEKNKAKSMMAADVPTALWHEVGIDLIHLMVKDYLVVIDYYSTFHQMELLTNISSAIVITHAKSIFARQGIPHAVVSENCPCFNSREWQTLYDLQHVTSSSNYAQTN